MQGNIVFVLLHKHVLHSPQSTLPNVSSPRLRYSKHSNNAKYEIAICNQLKKICFLGQFLLRAFGNKINTY